MGSALDDVKEVKIDDEVVLENEEKTSEKLPADHHPAETGTSEIVSVPVSEKEEIKNVSEKETNEILSEEKKTSEILPTVVFVLGGPGGGKSTQCPRLAKEIGYTHLSTGDLLRKVMESDSENGPMIESMITEGKSVPPDVTMRILKKAMDESGNNKFLLDGFPRDEEIRAAFEAETNIAPEVVLFLDCSEEERERRILSRDQGRVDDNPDSIRMRFKYFEEHTLPVVEYYRLKGKVIKIDAAKPVEEVFELLKSILNPPSIQAEVVETARSTPTTELENEIVNLKL